ncbi:twitch domain-containing radical SAM protein [Azospirillum sp. sgz302134]
MTFSDSTADSETDPSPSFCVLPWIHVFADETGVMHPCCRSVGSKLPNVRDDDGQPQRVHDGDGLEAGFNTRYMRELRRDMLDGRRPAPCERCYMYEDLGMRSHRQSQNAQHRALVPRLLAETDAEGRVPVAPRTVDLRLGNLCNLRCRMCSPQSSKGLIGEWADFHGVETTHPYFDGLRRLDWFARPEFWTMFEAHSGALDRLHFAGGEPLLIDAMFDFLERLVALDRAKDITISYNTNLTVLPERVFDLWPRFKAVRVTVSLDAVGAVNSFIRHPSNWDVLDANLRRLDREAARLNCTGGLGINTAVQVYNLFHLDGLLEYAAGSLARFEAPNLSILTYPEHLSVRILPPELKEQAESTLSDLLARSGARWAARWGEAQAAALSSGIQGVLDHMKKVDRSDLVPDFQRWSRHQDQHRRQDTRAVLPELAPLLAAAPDQGGPADHDGQGPPNTR